MTLGNIGTIYYAWGYYSTALSYLEQCLAISREIGDKCGETVTNWNIGSIYAEQGDLTNADQYISHAVELAEKTGHPSWEKYRKHLAALRAKMSGR